MNSQKTMAPRAAKKRNPWLIRGVLAALIVLVAGGGAAWYFLGAKTTTTQSTTQATSYTSTVTRSDLRVTASGSGSLIASNSVDLSFSTSGTVAELKVNLGDTVKSGQVLASLGNAEDLQAAVASQELALLQAQQALATLQQKGGVALAQAYQDMLTAQDNYATANQTNTRVASGATRCSSAVTAKYKSALDSATLRLNNIHAETVVSDAYISAKSAYDTAEANYIYCAGYTDNEKTSEKAALDVAKNTMDQAVNTYNTLKDASGIDPNTLALDTAKVKQTQTNLDNAQKNLDGIVLKAPMDGKVVYLAANQGAMVDTSKFITIADVTHPTVTVSVDETDMDKLVMGATAEVAFDALPGQTFTGKVVEVDPQLTTSGSYRVAKGQVLLDDSAIKTVQNLPLGLNATVTIVSQQAKNALVVPISALKDLGGGQYAVMISTGGTLKMQVVSVGINTGTYAEITSGLKDGDAVSTGSVQVKAGSSTTSTNTIKTNSNSTGGQPPNAPPGD